MQKKACPNCGYEQDSQYLFCGECGEDMNKTKEDIEKRKIIMKQKGKFVINTTKIKTLFLKSLKFIAGGILIVGFQKARESGKISSLDEFFFIIGIVIFIILIIYFDKLWQYFKKNRSLSKYFNIMKKFNKLFIFGISTIFLILIFSGLFFVDIGINSKFFIERDFNQAFEYRITGDCDSFIEYVYMYTHTWKEKCEKEKSHENEPIKKFTILQISQKFFNNLAFLQVELTKSKKAEIDYLTHEVLKYKDFTYLVNFEMKKDGLKWKIYNIDEEIK